MTRLPLIDANSSNPLEASIARGRKANAYYRMADAAHAKGDHTLGNHWASRAKEIELNAWHDNHIAPEGC